MGYYIDAETIVDRITRYFCMLMALVMFFFGMLGLGVILLAVVNVLRKDAYKNNYVVFEEEGIKILKYGKDWDLYLEWNKIQYAYKWASFNYSNTFYILSEHPVDRKRRNKIVDRMIRNFEDGLVIWINDMDPKAKDVEKIIQSKLSHLEMEERKPWYKYYNEKKQ